MACWPVLDSSVIKNIYLYIKKIIETITFGKCIFLSPCKSSISSVDTRSEAKSSIERKDFISTVAKIARPLSVTAKVNTFKSIFTKAVPSFANGIKIEIKKGYKNTKDTLFTSCLKSGLNKNTTIMVARK